MITEYKNIVKFNIDHINKIEQEIIVNEKIIKSKYKLNINTNYTSLFNILTYDMFVTIDVNDIIFHGNILCDVFFSYNNNVDNYDLYINIDNEDDLFISNKYDYIIENIRKHNIQEEYIIDENNMIFLYENIYIHVSKNKIISLDLLLSNYEFPIIMNNYDIYITVDAIDILNKKMIKTNNYLYLKYGLNIITDINNYDINEIIKIEKYEKLLFNDFHNIGFVLHNLLVNKILSIDKIKIDSYKKIIDHYKTNNNYKKINDYNKMFLNYNSHKYNYTYHNLLSDDIYIGNDNDELTSLVYFYSIINNKKKIHKYMDKNILNSTLQLDDNVFVYNIYHYASSEKSHNIIINNNIDYLELTHDEMSYILNNTQWNNITIIKSLFDKLFVYKSYINYDLIYKYIATLRFDDITFACVMNELMKHLIYKNVDIKININNINNDMIYNEKLIYLFIYKKLYYYEDKIDVYFFDNLMSEIDINQIIKHVIFKNNYQIFGCDIDKFNCEKKEYLIKYINKYNTDNKCEICFENITDINNLYLSKCCMTIVHKKCIKKYDKCIYCRNKT